MPELAEAEFFRKRWHLAARGAKIARVLTHDRAKIFRGTNVAALRRALTGARFESSETKAKQMLFRFSGGALPRRSRGWIGVHLGMSGALRGEPRGYTLQNHDHLLPCTPK